MYDAGKVIVGLGIFVVLFTSPVWYNLSMSQPVLEPDLTPARAMAKDLGGGCVADTAYMRARHMDLLNTWRNQVVREDDRFLKDKFGTVQKWSDGEPMQKSLGHTCLKCHNNYEQFCNRCHVNSQVELTCWNCHLNLSEGVK
jgi:hypothetical protein